MTAAPPSGPGRAVAVYTLHRLWLLGTSVLVLSLTGLRGLALAVVALLVSALLSTVLLRRQREAVALALAGSRQRAAGTAEADRERVAQADRQDDLQGGPPA